MESNSGESVCAVEYDQLHKLAGDYGSKRKTIVCAEGRFYDTVNTYQLTLLRDLCE